MQFIKHGFDELQNNIFSLFVVIYQSKCLSSKINSHFRQHIGKRKSMIFYYKRYLMPKTCLLNLDDVMCEQIVCR